MNSLQGIKTIKFNVLDFTSSFVVKVRKRFSEDIVLTNRSTKLVKGQGGEILKRRKGIDLFGISNLLQGEHLPTAIYANRIRKEDLDFLEKEREAADVLLLKRFRMRNDKLPDSVDISFDVICEDAGIYFENEEIILSGQDLLKLYLFLGEHILAKRNLFLSIETEGRRLLYSLLTDMEKRELIDSMFVVEKGLAAIEDVRIIKNIVEVLNDEDISLFVERLHSMNLLDRVWGLGDDNLKKLFVSLSYEQLEQLGKEGFFSLKRDLVRIQRMGINCKSFLKYSEFALDSTEFLDVWDIRDDNRLKRVYHLMSFEQRGKLLSNTRSNKDCIRLFNLLSKLERMQLFRGGQGGMQWLLMRPLFEENRIIDLIAVLDLEDFQCFWESIPVSYKTDKAVFNELFAGENNRILGLMFRFLPDTDRGMFFQLLDSDLRLKLYAQLTGDSVFDFYEMELAAF